MTVRDLRRRWKPIKLRLQAQREDHPTAIRVHRCCSWMQRVELEKLQDSDDAALILRWIALNSLYGRWDEVRREPAGDRRTLSEFADRILDLDQAGYVIAVLQQHKQLVLEILDDEYLAQIYWEDPCIEAAMRSKKSHEARQRYASEKYYRILWRLLERIYLLRCQLVHGAATAGGSLNRTALVRCNTMLSHLLPAVLLVVIDHGEQIDWGALCYPPRNATSV